MIPASRFPKQTIHPKLWLPLSRRSQIFPQTAPTITLQLIAYFDQAGPNGISIHIVTHRPQIKIIRAIHQQGFVASRKQMSPHPGPLFRLALALERGRWGLFFDPARFSAIRAAIWAIVQARMRLFYITVPFVSSMVVRPRFLRYRRNPDAVTP